MRNTLQVLFGPKRGDERLASLFLTPPRIERIALLDSRALLLSWRSKLISELVASGLNDEPDVSRLLRQKHGELFVDVGSNLGYYSRLLSPNFKRIIAIEMDPVISSYLSKTRPKNCTVVCAAIGNQEGHVRIQRYADNLGGAEIVNTSEQLSSEVRGTTLATLLSNEPHIDLVKVDVQGAEWLVLRGAESIMDEIDAWLIELHDLERRTELASYMEQFGYECRWLNAKAVHVDHGFFCRIGI